MSEVIYRKYRPQKFADLVNQEHIRRTLENEIKTGKISHAYLFSGPRGVGKTTTARLIAKSVNCLNRKEKESEPCNKCSHCLQLIAGNFLDLIEIDAASNRGIDEIRELREHVRFSPSVAKFKVFIIDEVHMLTTEAFNALLKTLEEPPSHAIFILCTTEPHKIPDTIISRCQRFDFRKVTLKDLVDRLEKISKSEGFRVTGEVLEIIAIRSEGCIRDAESLLQQVFSLGEKKIGLEEATLVIPRSDPVLVLKFCEFLFQNDVKDSLELISDLTNEGVDLERFTTDMIEFLRKILIFKSNSKLFLDITKETQVKLENLSNQIDNSRLTQLIELLLEKKQALKQTEIPQLPLELLVLEFCEMGKSDITPTPKSNPSPQESISNLPRRSSEGAKAGQQSAISNSNNVSINIDKVKKNWNKVLLEVQKHNHSICAFLKTGQIICAKKDVIEIGFPYKFHQQTIKNQKNRQIIEDCISQVLGQNIKIEVSHLPSDKKGDDNNLMTDMLAEFGGEVVE